MSKIKGTKRSLIGSIMALVFCCSIFMGATFAWFTDTATTGVNKVQAGNLDVDLVNKNGVSLVGKNLEFIKAQGAEGQPVLWEPGCTYRLPEIYVRNNGNLALKYKIAISGISSGDAKLLEAIEFSIKDQAGEPKNLSEYEGTLNAKETNSTGLVIEAKMKASAGNEYQGLSIEGIAITVYATQHTFESDSNGNQYDKDANMPEFVTTTEELINTLANAKPKDTIVLAAGEFSLPSNIKDSITIIGSGNTVIIPNGTNTNNVVNATNINVQNVIFDADQGHNAANGIALKFTGSGTFTNCTFTGSNGVRWSYANGDVVFKGCKIGSPKGIYGVHFDGGKGTVSLIDCEINGWTSFGSSIEKVTIENSKLFNNYSIGSYKVLRFYQDATVSNCHFNEKMVEISGAKDDITITINNSGDVSGFIKDYTDAKTVKFVVDGNAVSPK